MLADGLRFLQPFVFAAVALLAAARWWRGRDATSAWAALLLIVLAAATTGYRALPDETVGPALQLVVSVLLLFPFFLWRFAATLRRPRPRTDALVSAATLAPVATVWVVSVVVAVQLWADAAERPTVVQRRMRSLGTGVFLLALALVFTVIWSDGALGEVGGALLALASAPLLVVGMAPPDTLTARWRRPEEAELRAAEVRLAEAVDPDEVADTLLPHLVVLHVDPCTPYFASAEAGALARLAELTDVALRRAESTARERAAAREMERAHHPLALN